MAATVVQGPIFWVPNPNNPSLQVGFMQDAKGVTGFFYSTDGGQTFNPLLPIPGDRTQGGSVLTLDAQGKKGCFKSFPINSPGAAGVVPTFVDITYSDALHSGDTFGFFHVPAGYNLNLIEIHAFLQGPADNVVTVDLVNFQGQPQGFAISIPAGQQTGLFVLPQAFSMKANTVWNFKVLATGSSSLPGQQLQMRMALTKG